MPNLSRFAIVIWLTLGLSGDEWAVGDNLHSVLLPNQFDKTIQLPKETSCVIVSFSKESTAIINESMYSIEPLMYSKLYQIIDMSVAPKVVVDHFVKPKYRLLPHNVMFSYDKEFSLRIPYKEDEWVTFVLVDDYLVKSIIFASDEKAIRNQIEACLRYQGVKGEQ